MDANTGSNNLYDTTDYNSSSVKYPALSPYSPTILTPGGKAADMQAQVTRATWEDYKKRFVPESDALIASTGFMNPSLYTAQVQQGAGQVNSAYDATANSKAVALSRYGLGQTSEQQNYNRSLDNVSRSAAVVDAANKIRQKIKARDMNIVLGGTGE